jgi:NADH-quinone oxidoreductase subunit J
VTPGSFIFIILALVVVGTAIGMLISRSAVYSALFLVLNFVTVAMIYFMLGAPFIAMVQITVYAGSIMVMFLFVIMMLGAEKLPFDEPIHGQRPVAIVLGVAFLCEIVLFVLFRSQLTGVINPVAAGFGDPSAVGMYLFNQYALPVEITGFLLLVATVGAVLLTRGDAQVDTMTFFRKKKKE